MKRVKGYLFLCFLLLAATTLYLSSCKMSGSPGGGGNAGYVLVEEFSYVAPEGVSETLTKTSYISGNGLKLDDGERTMIITRKGGKPAIYSLMNAGKRGQDMSSMAAMIVDDMFAFDCDATGDCTDRRVSVTPTDEYQTVAGFKARKVEIKDKRSTTVGWFTKDSTDLIEAERVRRHFLADLVRASGRKVDRINSKTDEFGAPVMDETSLGKINFKSRFVSIEKKDMPPDFFDIPRGYEVEVIKSPNP